MHLLWIFIFLFEYSFYTFATDEYFNEEKITISETGLSAKPCGHENENPCSSISIAQTLYPSSTLFSYEKGTVEENSINITSMLLFIA